MEYVKSEDGLTMVPDVNDSADLRELERRLKDDGRRLCEQSVEFEWLTEQGFEVVAPEDCGALTDATLISDGDHIYGYMAYQVLSFLEEMSEGRSVFWTRG